MTDDGWIVSRDWETPLAESTNGFVPINDAFSQLPPQTDPSSGSPSWSDYAHYASSGAAGLIGSAAAGGSYIADKVGDQDLAAALSAVNRAAGDVQDSDTEQLTTAGKSALASWSHPLSHLMASAVQSAPSMAPVVIGSLIAGPAGGAVAQGLLSGSQSLSDVQNQIDNKSDDELKNQSQIYSDLRAQGMGENEARAHLRDTVAPVFTNALVGAASGVAMSGGAAGSALARASESALLGGGTNALATGISAKTISDALTNAGIDYSHPDYATAITTAGLLGAIPGAAHDLLRPHVEITGTGDAPTADQTLALKSSLPDPQPAGTPAPEIGKGIGPAGQDVLDKTAVPGIGPKGRAAIDAAPPVPDQAPDNVAPEQAPAVPDTPEPESPQTIQSQLDALQNGDRKAVLITQDESGYGGLAFGQGVPDGMRTQKIPQGMVIYNPDQLNRGQIIAAASTDRLNDILGLGPASKADVAASAAKGNPLVAVTERTPDGTETKSGVGTTETAPAQLNALEAQKSPGNTVSVENPESTLAARSDALRRATGGRDLSEAQPSEPRDASASSSMVNDAGGGSRPLPGKNASAERGTDALSPAARAEPEIERMPHSLGAAADDLNFHPPQINAETGAEPLIRAVRGHYNKLTARAQTDLEPGIKVEHSLGKDAKELLWKYIENRSTQPELRDDLPGRAQRVADTIRNVASDAKYFIQNVLDKDDDEFREDYLAHIWKRDKSYKAWDSMNPRSVPTIEEGLAAGLTPVHDTASATMQQYVNGMYRYLGDKVISQQLYKQGHVAPTKQDGLEKLYTGAFTRAPGWAPAKIAADYNHHFSRLNVSSSTREALNTVHDINDLARTVSFAGSLYHLSTVTLSSIGHGFAQSLEHVAAGKPIEGGKYALGAFLNPVTAAIKGKGVLDDWTGKNLIAERAGKRLSGLDADTIKAMKDANVIPTGHHIDYHKPQSFWTEAGRRGVVGAMKKEVQSATNAAIEGWAKTEGKGAARPAYIALNEARALARGLTRSVDNIVPVAQFLFNNFIPKLKAGLIFSQTKAWLAEHPQATAAERAQTAAKIGRGLDNIIGEMDPDNLFMNRALLEGARLVFLSPSFNIGSIRNLADAARQLPSAVTKNSMSVKSAAYSPALPLLIGQAAALVAVGSASTWLMTGNAPSSLLDIIAPPTGGKNDRGEDVRLKMPGEVNFVLDLEHVGGFPGGGAAGFYPEAVGLEPFKSKLNPLLGNAADLYQNEDYRHKPIVTADNPAQAALQAFSHVLSVAPFAVGDTSPWLQPDKSQIPLAAKVLDIPAAGMAYRAPERYRAMIQREKHKQAPKS